MFESLLWEVRGLFEAGRGVKSDDEYLGSKTVSDRIRRRDVRIMHNNEIKANAKLLEIIGEDMDCDLLAELIVQAKEEGITLEASESTYKAISESFSVPKEVAEAVVITNKLLSYIKGLNLSKEDLQLIREIGEVLSQADPETGLPLDADTIAENLNVPLQTVLRIKEIIETFQKENAESVIIVQGNTGDQELEKPFTIDTTGDTSQAKSQAKTNNNKRRGQQQQQKEASVAASVTQ